MDSRMTVFILNIIIFDMGTARLLLLACAFAVASADSTYSHPTVSLKFTSDGGFEAVYKNFNASQPLPPIDTPIQGETTAKKSLSYAMVGILGLFAVALILWLVSMSRCSGEKRYGKTEDSNKFEVSNTDKRTPPLATAVEPLAGTGTGLRIPGSGKQLRFASPSKRQKYTSIV